MTRRSLMTSSLETREEERAVRTAEAERVVQDVPKPPLRGPTGHVVERTLRILLHKVCSGRNPSRSHGERTHRALDRARGSEQVAHHRLGRADPEFLAGRMLAEDAEDRLALLDITDRCRGA